MTNDNLGDEQCHKYKYTAFWLAYDEANCFTSFALRLLNEEVARILLYWNWNGMKLAFVLK